MRTISMFLGYKTETDVAELADYIAALIKSEGAEGKKMQDGFDAEFPGVRTAALLALKDVEHRLAAGKPTLLEYKGGRFRARTDDVFGEWQPVAEA